MDFSELAVIEICRALRIPTLISPEIWKQQQRSAGDQAIDDQQQTNFVQADTPIEAVNGIFGELNKDDQNGNNDREA
jgi:hypothetical protein